MKSDRAIILAVVVAAIGLGLAATGCTPPPKPTAEIWSASSEGVLLEVSTRTRKVFAGEMLPLTVTVRNSTPQEVGMNATSGALVGVSVLRQTAAGWEVVKKYPDTAVMVASPWRLGPRGSRVFHVNLPVAPDWPTNEALRIEVQVNGWPDLKAGGIVQVVPECDRVGAY